MNRFLSVTEFKTRCLACLTEVEQTGGTITLTRRGRPVAVVGPAKRRAFKSFAGAFDGRMKGVVMKPRLLRDSHILLRWASDRKSLRERKLPRFFTAMYPGEPVAIGAIALLEIAMLATAARASLKVRLANPDVHVIPLNSGVALEAAALPSQKPSPRLFKNIFARNVHIPNPNPSHPLPQTP